MLTLKGRTCIFAGAVGGDGERAVEALCAGGMNVAIMTNKAAANVLADKVNAAGHSGRCGVFLEGFGPKEDRDAAYQKVYETFGSIDVVICNKGGGNLEGSIDTLDVNEMGRNVAEVVEGCLGMLQSAMPYLLKSKAPRAIFMTTVEGCNGGTCEGLTSAVSRGAVRSFTLNTAARLARDGVTVNCISKGIGNGAAAQKETVEETGGSLIPVGRAGTPEDLAAAICFLASEESGYVTGQILEVNGGLQLGR